MREGGRGGGGGRGGAGGGGLHGNAWITVHPGGRGDNVSHTGLLR